MNIAEQIIEIITRKKTILYSQNKAEKELLVLLQKLTEDDKKSLKPTILKLLRKYNKEAFSVEGSDDKYRLACTAGFVMLSYSEYKAHWAINYDKILDWYCPSWFSEYYNNDQWINFGYNKLLEYMDKGYITPSGSKIAQELVALENNEANFHKITLTEHIWTLFQYESEVHLTQRYPKFNKIEWKSKLLELAKDKKVDRDKLLQECLYTSTRNFNKVAVGFFFDLFSELEPSDKELLNLQDTLFLVLQTQHSKPINQTLKYLKRIHREPNFNISGFMEQIPVLLSWNVKAVVNGTLSLIDALMKAYSDNKEELGLLVVQTLGQEDESLQSKAVKLLAKHKLLETQSILEEIDIYAEGLYRSTKSLLPKLNEATENREQTKIIPPQYIREDNKIVYPESFDELVFFFSQVFEGNSVYDFDLFVALLPKLKEKITNENISKLDPAFQRALRVYASKNSESTNHSKITPLMAVTFLEFAMYLRGKFPKTLNKIEKDYKEVLSFFAEYNSRTSWSGIVELEGAMGCLVGITNISLDNGKIERSIETKKPFGNIESTYAHLLVHMIHSKYSFTPISTPTHAPCWIEPSILIKRIEYLQKNQIELNLFDIQIALSRVTLYPNDIDTSRLDKEFQNLFNYLISDTPLDVAQIDNPAFWLIFVLRKNNEHDAKLFTDTFSKNGSDVSILANPSWHAYREPWEYEEWEKGIKVKKTIMSPKFKIERRRIVENLPFESIFRHSAIRSYEISARDCCSYLYLAPTLPRFLLQNLIVYSGKGYGDAFTHKTLDLVSSALLEIWNNFGKTEYLFLAFVMIYETKTTRQIASELWIKATSEGTMNHQLLGETLGKLEYNEYAPLKRFTDLIVANMLNISGLHNEGLHTLLSVMIANMNDEPIKGTKKLLEIYLEVLSLTKLDVPDETMDKLVIWGEVKSLKGVVKKIVKVK